ncbi:MAG TPA: hypothetical protein PLB52_01610 [Candidatus Moranbacteria bacterium]|nr:hypothetical protein [Candidatus Moranbacteria bacterium]
MTKIKINLFEKISKNKIAIALGAAFILIAILSVGIFAEHRKIEKMQKIVYSNTNLYSKISNFQQAGLEKSSVAESSGNARPEKKHKIFSGFASNLVNSNYAGQNMRDNIWLILAIKSIFLVTMMAILFVLIKRSIKNFRNRNKKPSSQTVKQAVKNRPRAIKKAKRK